jgi:hypothetical protein
MKGVVSADGQYLACRQAIGHKAKRGATSSAEWVGQVLPSPVTEDEGNGLISIASTVVKESFGPKIKDERRMV